MDFALSDPIDGLIGIEMAAALSDMAIVSLV